MRYTEADAQSVRVRVEEVLEEYLGESEYQDTEVTAEDFALYLQIVERDRR